MPPWLDTTLTAISEANAIGGKLYADKALSGAFSGFLSMSGFIFSMHTFIVIKTKELVYDKDFYRDSVQKIANTHRVELAVYENLNNLNEKLLRCLKYTLIASIVQFPFGYIPYLWVICPISAIIGICMLLSAIGAVRTNMSKLMTELLSIKVKPQ